MSRRFRRSALIGSGLATVLVAGTVLVACSPGTSGDSNVAVTGAYIPLPATPGGMAAGYLTVQNIGSGADQLVKVSSPGAKSVTMHRSTDTTMEEVGALPVAAHGKLLLERGGNHLMIMGWTKAPAVGDVLELDLTFARGRTISVQAPVKPLTYRPGS
ncbi:copper chaperone PCu(A)C [Kitasatospora sp. MAP5-34]|uniref:copper chaperone PCu(A)C n=1 Tax=Kitasatospora sp. MAP5-34 TaxID=3035102 RepID=UPI00247633DF|nr:copper chaperone PCu(A)C [Kitasatospora sp. MAP5-34]MDH6577466.1 copper(I)-binding protein [Kitasatospora sp. MAP5-34]